MSGTEIVALEAFFASQRALWESIGWSLALRFAMASSAPCVRGTRTRCLQNRKKKGSMRQKGGSPALRTRD